MRATIREVAEEANVSHTTVSMVLRGIDGRTTPETRQRVLEVAHRLNYVPVKPPTSQNRPLETRIVTLVPEHRDFENHRLDKDTYWGVLSSARQHDYNVLTLLSGGSERFAAEKKNQFLDRHSDGFIFAMSAQGDWEDTLQTVVEHGIPTVVCYRQDVPAGVAFADMDNERAMSEAVQHLVQQGHRRIVYLAGPQDNFNEHERRRGWIKAMAAADLDFDESAVIQGLDSGFAPRPDSIRSVVRSGATAVVCYNDPVAVLLWNELEKQGLNVPDDLSIIGMNDDPVAAQRGLSSFAHSFTEVGSLAMEAWFEMKNGGDAKSCSKLAPVRFISRASVGRAKP